MSNWPWEQSRCSIFYIFHHLMKYAYNVIFVETLKLTFSVTCWEGFALPGILSSGINPNSYASVYNRYLKICKYTYVSKDIYGYINMCSHNTACKNV